MGDYRDEEVGVLRMRSLPNFWLHASCDHAVVTRMLPDGLAKTRMRSYWLVHRDAREGEDYQLDRLLPFWHQTNEQDWEICRWQQKGIESIGYEPGPLSQRKEYNVDAFIRWYMNELRGDRT
jgi:Rieske 2Fe-2S family protein